MTAWGARLGLSMVIIAALEGVFIVLAGLKPSIALISVALFALYFCFPFFAACSQSIWQRKIPLNLQGRIVALKQVWIWSGLLISYLISGPLADQVLEPFAASQAFAATIGVVIGTGAGRGMAFCLVIASLAIVAAAMWGYSQQSLRHIESEVQEHI